MTLRIAVDHREDQAVIAHLYEQDGVEISVEQLPLGDYVVTRDTECNGNTKLMFERKSGSDFIGSTFSKHLDDQLSRMLNEKGAFSILVVEQFDSTGVHFRRDRSIYAAMAKHVETVNLRVPVLKTKNIADTVEKIVYYSKKFLAGELDLLRRPVVVSEVTNPIIAFYCMLPKIGPGLAEKIAAKFPKPVAFMDAVEATCEYVKAKHGTKSHWREEVVWWNDIDGISDGRAAEIATFLLDGLVVRK